MKRVIRYSLFFAIGAIGYTAIELLWRGRTHWSMGIAGGLCFIIFSVVAKHLKEKPLLLKAALIALSITVVEFAFGIVFNVILGMKIWDYSNVPFNIMGQICPSFTLLWGVLAIIFLPLANIINERIEERYR